MTSGSNVWNKPYIKAALLTFSFGKCCYCECKIDEESKYLEVEHFLPKTIYPERVVDWGNLLPSCKRCNGAKSSHDTHLEPIVNPTIDEPGGHLILRAYRFYHRTDIGKKTIEVVDLNDKLRRSLVRIRFEIGEKMIEQLDEIWETCQEVNPTPQLVRRIYSKIRGLLQESIPSAKYSATAATVLFSPENHFSEIKQRMEELNIWDEELERLEHIASSITLFG